MEVVGVAVMNDEDGDACAMVVAVVEITAMWMMGMRAMVVVVVVVVVLVSKHYVLFFFCVFFYPPTSKFTVYQSIPKCKRQLGLYSYIQSVVLFRI